MEKRFLDMLTRKAHEETERFKKRVEKEIERQKRKLDEKEEKWRQEDQEKRGEIGAASEVYIESDEEPYPDVWPPRTSPDLLRLRVIKSTDFEDKKREFYSAQYENAKSAHGQTLTYLMKKKKRALVHVINNEKFDTLTDRDGTAKDELGLRMLFQKVGCDVKTRNELKSADMWKYLKDLSQRDFMDYDCFILFILTHGHKGVVFGTDGYLTEKKDANGKVVSETPHNCLRVEKIVDLFTQVEQLQGKPKLFFIQACQGSFKDKGKDKSSVPDGSASDGSSEPQTPAPPMPEPLESSHHGEEDSNELKFLTMEESDSVKKKLPSKADVFIAMATTSDNVAWRKPDFGTWFIQAIVEVFARYAYKKEIHDLMRRVNALIVRAETKRGAYKQVMERRDTFQKRFFFFPGLHDESEAD